MITGLQARNNNCSTTILDLFKHAIAEYQMLPWARGDCSGENIDITNVIIPGQHETPALNIFIANCLDFQQDWNCHLISGPDNNNKSPNDICFLGQMEFGLYRDDSKRKCMYVTDKYYGAADEEGSDDEECAALKAQTTKLAKMQQQQHMHEGPVYVPSHQTPFTNPEDFFGVLQEVISQNIVPDSFSVTSEEWEVGQYPILKTVWIERLLCGGHKSQLQYDGNYGTQSDNVVPSCVL
ncbi:hypothetical protein EDD17DRAFT_1510232 [Pisolithus thermaeus]|nr:hypothetical protein EDD17DRAFT_1510232 [Pisolithus thermaeus]